MAIAPLSTAETNTALSHETISYNLAPEGHPIEANLVAHGVHTLHPESG